MALRRKHTSSSASSAVNQSEERFTDENVRMDSSVHGGHHVVGPDLN